MALSAVFQICLCGIVVTLFNAVKMKKIVSTQGLTYGEFRENSISIAISERINNRLEHSFFQNYGEVVHTSFNLSYNVIAGEITQIVFYYRRS